MKFKSPCNTKGEASFWSHTTHMLACMNYSCFCACSSANICGIPALMETLMGISMVVGVVLKTHTNRIFHSSSTTALEWDFSAWRLRSLLIAFSDLEAPMCERALIRPTKSHSDPLLAVAGSNWRGYCHLAESYQCSHGHCLLPHGLTTWVNLNSCASLLWQTLKQVQCCL